MRNLITIVGTLALGIATFSASTSSQAQDATPKKGKKGGGPKKMELPHPFYWAAPDPYRGDWQGTNGFVAQVFPAHDKELSTNDLIPDQADNYLYEANVYKQFDVADNKPVAVLHGQLTGETITFTGDGGWTGTIESGHFKASHGPDSFDLAHVARNSATLGAKAPAGATVLFDGKNLDAWAKMKEKDWLIEDGPAQWHLVPGDAVEVVPHAGNLISHKWFGDMKLHVEFRNLGGPTNSGVYLQDRYESNINEVYGKLTGNPCAGFDNSLPVEKRSTIRASRPVLEWQTLDIDFKAPRFDAEGKRTAAPRVTLLLNGVKMYDDTELGPVTLNAARLGEAPTGPIQLQEHGMPVQFRNIWVVGKAYEPAAK